MKFYQLKLNTIVSFLLGEKKQCKLLELVVSLVALGKCQASSRYLLDIYSFLQARQIKYKVFSITFKWDVGEKPKYSVIGSLYTIEMFRQNSVDSLIRKIMESVTQFYYAFLRFCV